MYQAADADLFNVAFCSIYNHLHYCIVCEQENVWSGMRLIHSETSPHPGRYDDQWKAANKYICLET